MEKAKEYESLIAEALSAYDNKEIGECRRALADYFSRAGENACDHFPRDLKEGADFWYAVMIDTGLCGGCVGSPERTFFVQAATHKFAAAPPELREKFMEGLDVYFPPGPEEGGEGA